jgi:hypothetical protein
MDFRGPSHIYWVAPPTNGNLDAPAGEQVLIGLRCVTVPDLDAERIAISAMTQDHAQSKWAQLQADRTVALIAGKFAGAKNLTLAGAPVRDWAHFYAEGPPEMVSWVCKAVMSCELLTEAEVKNFSPASVSASI